MANIPQQVEIQGRVRLAQPRPRGRQVSYAEELGLTALPAAATAAADALGIQYHQRHQAEASVRDIKALIASNENRVLEQLRQDNPEVGPTAFERLAKQALASDEMLAALGQDLRDRQGDLGEIEAEVKANEGYLRASTAQMNMLGGYFAYLAASKEAQTTDKIFGQVP